MLKIGFKKIRQFYDDGLWTREMVADAVVQGCITAEEAIEIIGSESAVEDLRAAKIQAMSKTCADVIIAGIDYEGKHYSMAVEDQLNMMSLLGSVQQGAESVPYHADGEECRFYSAAEFMAIADLATRHKIYQESYFNSLRSYIESMTTMEELSAVTYGVEIPLEYQTEVLRRLTPAV